MEDLKSGSGAGLRSSDDTVSLPQTTVFLKVQETSLQVKMKSVLIVLEALPSHFWNVNNYSVLPCSFFALGFHFHPLDTTGNSELPLIIQLMEKSFHICTAAPLHVPHFNCPHTGCWEMRKKVDVLVRWDVCLPDCNQLNIIAWECYETKLSSREKHSTNWVMVILHNTIQVFCNRWAFVQAATQLSHHSLHWLALLCRDAQHLWL